jgi:long-chain acyl-CoA synthetase
MSPIQAARRVGMLCRRDQTLGTIMDRLAGVHGDRRLVEEDDGGMRLTYDQAARCVNRWARGIREQTEVGDRVVVATPNGYEQFLVCLAAARAGAIPVPVNPQMRPEEMRHVTRDCGATFTVHHSSEIDRPEPLDALDDVVSADPGDVAALFYTSGTTGKPKGAALTHRALLSQAVAGALWPAGLRRDEAVFSLPVAHIMGFAALMGFACAGIPVFAMSHFRPDTVLEAIEARRCTIFIGVPAMYRLMLEAGAEERDLSCIRLWGSGADVMPTELALQFKHMGATATLPLAGPVGEAMFIEGYGMVEVGGGVAFKFSPPMLRLGLGDSLGVSMPQYKLRVADTEGR